MSPRKVLFCHFCYTYLMESEIVANKNRGDLRWWESMQALCMRLSYIIFATPMIIWIVTKLNEKSFGDPFSVIFWSKIYGGAIVLVLILLIPIFIQKKLMKLRTQEENQSLRQALKPFPLETPIYTYLVGIIILPFGMQNLLVGIIFGVVLIILDEVYLKNNSQPPNRANKIF